MREQLRIDVAELWFKAVSKRLDDPAEKRVRRGSGAKFVLLVERALDQGIQREGRPSTLL